jgi:predicted class III extradiol MEMO1 family dioxygenase
MQHLTDGYTSKSAVECMGLPQAGSLGHDLLEQRLNKEEYFQSQIVPPLWKHKTKPIQFVLVVDNYGIKYLKKEDLDHLIQTLEKHYVSQCGSRGVRICENPIRLGLREQKIPLVNDALPSESSAKF